jgi:hypothetical protein
MKYCQTCIFRKKYDHNPHSILARLWKWHTGWWPGWKSYLNSLPDERRKKILQKYSRMPAV